MTEPQYEKCPHCGKMGIPLTDENISLTASLGGTKVSKGSCVFCGFEVDNDLAIVRTSVSLMYEKKFDEALSKIGALSSEFENDFYVQFVKGMCYQAMEKFDKALESYNFALGSKVDYFDGDKQSYNFYVFEVLYLKALCSYSIENFEDAILTINELFALNRTMEEEIEKLCFKTESDKAKFDFFIFESYSLLVRSYLVTGKLKQAENTLTEFWTQYTDPKKWRLPIGVSLVNKDDEKKIAGFLPLDEKQSNFFINYFFITESYKRKNVYLQFFTAITDLLNTMNQEKGDSQYKVIDNLIQTLMPLDGNENANVEFYAAAEEWLTYTKFVELVMKSELERAFEYVEKDGVDFTKILKEPDHYPYDLKWEEFVDLPEVTLRAEGIFEEVWSYLVREYFVPIIIYSKYLSQGSNPLR